MNSDDDTRIENGSARAVCTSATPSWVSYSPTLMNRVTSGSARMASGKARVITISTRYTVWPRKSYRASAYPAGAPRSTANTMVSIATTTLFQTAVQTPV